MMGKGAGFLAKLERDELEDYCVDVEIENNGLRIILKQIKLDLKFMIIPGPSRSKLKWKQKKMIK